MKILILNWRDIRHPLGGGAEASLFEHAKYWKKRGSEITWFSSSFAGGKKKEIIDGIKIVRRGSHYTAHLWAYFYFIFNKFEKPDIVVDSFHFIPFFTPLYIKKNKIVGLINEVAGRVWFANLFYPFALIGYYLEPKFFKFYKKNLFITGSNSTKEELVKIGLPSKHIKIVHHGINITKDKNSMKKEKTPTLIFLGRISIDKGIEDALKAYEEIKGKHKEVKLWIIGKEEKPGIIKTLLHEINSKEVRRSIKYFGFVDEKKKFELLKRAWILIHPSTKEGWGLNVIEAATQGTPTVGYNVEGLRDSVQHGKTGILVSSQTPSLLSAAILTIIMDKTKTRLNRLSKNAIKWSKNFNWSTSTRQSWDVIRRIYEGKK